jgi:hypothetical protein
MKRWCFPQTNQELQIDHVQISSYPSSKDLKIKGWRVKNNLTVALDIFHCRWAIMKNSLTWFSILLFFRKRKKEKKNLKWTTLLLCHELICKFRLLTYGSKYLGSKYLGPKQTLDFPLVQNFAHMEKDLWIFGRRSRN